MAAVVALSILVGCAPAAPAATTPVAKPGAPAAAKFGPKFQALLDKAKAGDGHIRAGLSAYTPEFIKAMEKQFGEEFGINITLENEPGHASREIPPKMIQAQKVGKGLVDYIDGGNPSNFAPLMQQDALQIPQWDALQEQWPQITDLRKLYPDVPGGPNGTTLQDYCMLASQTTWTLIYNTRNVKPADVQGIKWDDLLTARWKGRVAWDAQALGFKELPFHPAWPISWLKAFTTNLGANKVKLIDGGTNGVIQAVIQGEGDNFDKVEENRKIAIEGMKAGLQSGQMVPYP
jgi:ABC-type Fe3+ transport system substrate-binding protein